MKINEPDKHSSDEPPVTSSDNQRNQRRAEENNRSGVLEKIFTVFSLVLIFSAVAFLIKESTAPQTPPAFTLKTADPILRGDFTAVDVYIENSGDQAAKAVHLKGEISTSKKPVEAETTIDWLPGHSTRKATLVFPRDTGTSRPQLEVIGYEEP